MGYGKQAGSKWLELCGLNSIYSSWLSENWTLVPVDLMVPVCRKDVNRTDTQVLFLAHYYTGDCSQDSDGQGS